MLTLFNVDYQYVVWFCRNIDFMPKDTQGLGQASLSFVDPLRYQDIPEYSQHQTANGASVTSVMWVHG